MLLDAGYAEVKEGKFSDRMIDDMVVHGSAEQVKERLRTLPSFGVKEFLATVIEPKTTAGRTNERYARWENWRRNRLL